MARREFFRIWIWRRLARARMRWCSLGRMSRIFGTRSPKRICLRETQMLGLGGGILMIWPNQATKTISAQATISLIGIVARVSAGHRARMVIKWPFLLEWTVCRIMTTLIIRGGIASRKEWGLRGPYRVMVGPTTNSTECTPKTTSKYCSSMRSAWLLRSNYKLTCNLAPTNSPRSSASAILRGPVVATTLSTWWLESMPMVRLRLGGGTRSSICWGQYCFRGTLACMCRPFRARKPWIRTSNSLRKGASTWTCSSSRSCAAPTFSSRTNSRCLFGRLYRMSTRAWRTCPRWITSGTLRR